MENLREHLEDSLNVNESRTNTRDIEQYCKSWITQCSGTDEASRIVEAVLHGIERGCEANAKYSRDDDEKMNWMHLHGMIADALAEFE